MKALFLLFVWLADVGRFKVTCQDDVITRCPRDLPRTSDMRLFEDICYQFVSQEMYWGQARDYCLRNGGRLVKIDDPETNEFIINSLNDLWWRNNGVWIGLHDLNSELHWQWTGYDLYQNEPVRWTNWGRGHPGAVLHRHRDCVRMVREGGLWKWHETFCNKWKWHYRFICEYKMYPSEMDSANYSAQNTQIEPSVQFGQPESDSRKLTHQEEEVDEMQHENQPQSFAAIESDRLQQEEEDESSKTTYVGGTLAMAIGCILVGTLTTALIFLLYNRRRFMRGRNRGNSCEIAAISKDKDEYDETTMSRSPRPPRSRPMAIANIYVDTDDDRFGTAGALPKQNDGNDSESYQGDDDDDDDDDGDVMRREGLTSIDETLVAASSSRRSRREHVKYDVPKSINVYSEIADNDEYPDSRHIYEALSEVQKY